MADPVKIITFGGAKFDENQVASKSTVNKNGKTYYVVNFKTGAKVQYPAQAEKNNARIDVGRDESMAYVGYFDDNKNMEYLYDNIGKPGFEKFDGQEGDVYQKADKYTISQFWGLEFSGSQKPDDINLYGCSRCTVNVKGGNSMASDSVNIQKSSKYISQHNEVIMDAKDVVVDNTEWIDGADGIHHEGDSRNLLQ